MPFLKVEVKILVALSPAAGFVCAVNQPHQIMKLDQFINRIFRPFYCRRLRRNIRGWIADAVKKGPNSVEAKFVSEWSETLRNEFGL